MKNSLTFLHVFVVMVLVSATGCDPVRETRVEVERWAIDATPIDRSASELAVDTAENLAWAKSYYRRIMDVTGPRTVENTLEPLNELAMHLEASASECSLFSQVHPDPAVREAAEKGVTDIARYQTSLNLDRDLYEAVKGVDLKGADASTRYHVEKLLRDFRRAGVDKSEAVRTRVARLNDRIVALGQEFARNIAADVREITLDSEAKLAGMPDDWMDQHRPGADGKIHVTTRYPDAGPLMTYAHDAGVRRAMYHEFRNRAYPQNIGVLEKLLAARYELATMLDYPSWADYVTEDKMIGSAEAVATFLDRIADAGKAAADEEYALLLKRKRKDDPSATKVEAWERSYYSNLVRAETFAFDAQAVRPYFNFEDVRSGIFDLTGELFGIEYVRVGGLDLWHDKVTAWDVYDDGRRLGRFYLDLHPRDNKYSHAACFEYREGVKSLRLPQAVLVCNFSDPQESGDGKALMEHDDVVTFFHEFGHLLHAIFAGHQQWLGNSGISTEWDFVEAPSQMLEEWCYTVEPLRYFARHHETGEPIPAELVANLKRAAEFGKALDNAHQVFYSAVSLNYYNQDPANLDTTDAMIALQGKYSPFPYEDGTHFQCSFGHLDGYSAIYYTYRWSLVIAKAMFSRFEREGLLNTRTATAYRKAVLEPGGSRPAAALIEDFLGRPYTFEPFERWLNGGLNAEVASAR